MQSLKGAFEKVNAAVVRFQVSAVATVKSVMKAFVKDSKLMYSFMLRLRLTSPKYITPMIEYMYRKSIRRPPMFARDCIVMMKVLKI